MPGQSQDDGREEKKERRHEGEKPEESGSPLPGPDSLGEAKLPEVPKGSADPRSSLQPASEPFVPLAIEGKRQPFGIALVKDLLTKPDSRREFLDNLQPSLRRAIDRMPPRTSEMAWQFLTDIVELGLIPACLRHSDVKDPAVYEGAVRVHDVLARAGLAVPTLKVHHDYSRFVSDTLKEALRERFPSNTQEWRLERAKLSDAAMSLWWIEVDKLRDTFGRNPLDEPFIIPRLKYWMLTHPTSTKP